MDVALRVYAAAPARRLVEMTGWGSMIQSTDYLYSGVVGRPSPGGHATGTDTATDTAMRKIIHIDMDCFFAAVEMRDNPALREVPLAMVAPPTDAGHLHLQLRGAPLRVRSAMPSALARKLCPPLVLIPGRMAVYKETSRQLRAIFLRYTEQVEPLSLDEAYLDVTQSPRCGGSATLMAAEIRAAISAELGLTASAGWRRTSFWPSSPPSSASLTACSSSAPRRWTSSCASSLGKLPGIGRKTAERLESLGLYSCEDARQLGNEELIARFGKLGEMLARPHLGA